MISIFRNRRVCSLATKGPKGPGRLGRTTTFAERDIRRRESFPSGGQETCTLNVEEDGESRGEAGRADGKRVGLRGSRSERRGVRRSDVEKGHYRDP